MGDFCGKMFMLPPLTIIDDGAATAGIAGVPGGPAPALRLSFLATQTSLVVAPGWWALWAADPRVGGCCSLGTTT